MSKFREIYESVMRNITEESLKSILKDYIGGKIGDYNSEFSTEIGKFEESPGGVLYFNTNFDTSKPKPWDIKKLKDGLKNDNVKFKIFKDNDHGEYGVIISKNDVEKLIKIIYDKFDKKGQEESLKSILKDYIGGKIDDYDDEFSTEIGTFEEDQDGVLYYNTNFDTNWDIKKLKDGLKSDNVKFKIFKDNDFGEYGVTISKDDVEKLIKIIYDKFEVD